MGEVCGRSLWEKFVGEVCGRSWWEKLVGEVGGRSWWQKLVGEVGGRSWWQKLAAAVSTSKAAASFWYRHGVQQSNPKDNAIMSLKKFYASQRMGDGQIFIIFSATLA